MTSYVGNREYMAPEVFERAAVPYKGDIYALGLILHYMMAKDLPSIKHHVKTGNFNIPSIYSEDIIILMRKMLKKKPE